MSLHILYCHCMDDPHTAFSICDSCVFGGVMGTCCVEYGSGTAVPSET